MYSWIFNTENGVISWVKWYHIHTLFYIYFEETADISLYVE